MTADSQLDATLRAFYEAHVLSPEECDAILREPPLPSAAAAAGSERRRWLVAAAAVIAMGLVGLGWVMTDSKQEPNAKYVMTSNDSHVPPQESDPPKAPTPSHAVATAPEGKEASAHNLTVISLPSGASVLLGKIPQGVTPLEIEGLVHTRTYFLHVILDGYRPYSERIALRGDENVIVKLVPYSSTPDSPASDARSCTQDGSSELSVMALGASDCHVTVGPPGDKGRSLGLAPQFKHSAPVGQCEVQIRCLGGKHYATILNLRDGESSKIIVKPDMWLRQGEKGVAPPPKPNPRVIKEGTEGAKEAYALGTQAVKQRNYEEGIEHFLRCVEKDRTFAACYRALGICYAKLGNSPRALRYYKLYLKFAPKAADAPQVRRLLDQSRRK